MEQNSLYKQYSLYIFDMGGVVTTSAFIEKQMSETLHVSVNDFHAFSDELLAQLSDGAISTKEFWNSFSQRSGIAVKTDWWHWLFHPVRNEQTCDIVRRLKASGKRVVCGTNTIDSHYRNHCERGDYELFDQTYASFLMGVSKPDVAFWNIILAAEKVKPEDAVFVDDKKENCEAAASLGIHAIQFTTAEALATALEMQ
ncbi:MAG: HAD family phosphatase [Treponema sp.]|nr:HAD family phosphatase [Treponema sp.]